MQLGTTGGAGLTGLEAYGREGLSRSSTLEAVLMHYFVMPDSSDSLFESSNSSYPEEKGAG